MHSLLPRICIRSHLQYATLAQHPRRQMKLCTGRQLPDKAGGNQRIHGTSFYWVHVDISYGRPTCEVEAVGIGATSSELRTPCAAISRLSAAQSQSPDEGTTPHMSYWRIPWLTGEPCHRQPRHRESRSHVAEAGGALSVSCVAAR